MEKFCVVANSWLKEKNLYVKNTTMSVYKHLLSKYLLPRFGNMTSISEDTVQQFVIQLLEQGRKPNSVRSLLLVLKMIVRYGHRKGMFHDAEWSIRFPTAVHGVEAIPVMSLIHQRRLMKHLQQNLCCRNLGILISLCTGMRIGELCALRWQHVDTKNGTIRVERTLGRIYDCEEHKTYLVEGLPKTSSSRRLIPINKELQEILAVFKRFAQEDYYVLTNKPSPTEPRTYRRYYNRLLDSLDIPRLKFHGLRHSFATRCIEKRCDYKTVSAILGHASLSTTMDLYVHPDLAQKRQCIVRSARLLE
ncbi:MAG: site-specific integrase [Prevotella sp.]|nr:site-specific integrase [Prevotella sp.]